MTIRDAIDQLLTGQTPDGLPANDPATVMADNGYGDVPTELFGTALVHFSDTAPLEQADALAPVVTRVSPIPYDEADLSPIGTDETGIPDDVLDGSDPYALFTSVEPQVLDLEDMSTFDDLDAHELDSDASSSQTEAKTGDTSGDLADDMIDEDAIDLDDLADDGLTEESDFGSGTTSSEELLEIETPAPTTEVAAASAGSDDYLLDEVAPRFGEPSVFVDPPELTDPIEDEGVDLFTVEFDESDQADEGIDPDDLDFS